MRRIFTRILFAADDGLPAGGGDEPSADPSADPASVGNAEAEKLKKQLEEERLAREAAEKKLAEEAKGRMTEDQRRQVELEEERRSLLAEHEILQLKAVGVTEEFQPLVAGSNSGEVHRNGELLGKLIEQVRAETEAKVKKDLARTGAPAADLGDNGDGEVDGESYFTELLKRQKGGDQ